MTKSINYSKDPSTRENMDSDEKYSVTGESEYTRESIIPFDQDEVLAERHYTFQHIANLSKTKKRNREPKDDALEKRPVSSHGYRRSDSLIHSDIRETLYRSSLVDSLDIEVRVKNGTVTLNGFVQIAEEKKEAQSLILNLAGVEEIHNDIRVRGENSHEFKKSKFGLIDNITGLN